MTHDMPDVQEADLTRTDMEELAAELGVDAEGLSDQELLEQLGVALGEIDQADVDEAHAAAQQEPGAAEAETPDESGGSASKAKSGGQKAKGGRKSKKSRKAETDSADEQDGAADRNGASEQAAPGEAISGPTRNQLREQLQEKGLPVGGTKDELQQRLAKAEKDASDEQRGKGGSQDAANDGGEDEERDGGRESQQHDTKTAKLKQKVSQYLTSRSPGDEGEQGDQARTGEDGSSQGESAAPPPEAQEGDRTSEEPASEAGPAEVDDAQGIRGRVGQRLISVGHRLKDSGDQEDDERADAGDGDGETADEERFRDHVADALDGTADKLESTAERLRESGEEESDEEESDSEGSGVVAAVKAEAKNAIPGAGKSSDSEDGTGGGTEGDKESKRSKTSGSSLKAKLVKKAVKKKLTPG